MECIETAIIDTANGYGNIASADVSYPHSGVREAAYG